MSNPSPSPPRVGVGAFITRRPGQLLLVKRLRAPEAGCWGLPGGKVDFGERLVETVAREILEEVGVVIAVGALICIVDQIDLEAGTHWVAPTYRASLIEGEPVNREPQALEAIGWFGRNDLPSPLTLSARRALEVLGDAAWI
ncbi:NUDIX domain-containing protein [Phenylobacterium aquaticum]|uniref:NUDIX domain-containing protein n=1 Tax=Phenylobacterium aquaticum TaxID=1763816 RepID=UPI0026EAA712|nr:NUDIX domain-containing protein [Phenylobacterium aquaticum]